MIAYADKLIDNRGRYKSGHGRMDFEFKTFSHRSFERFAQALAAQVIGPGLVVFGDGPDGGREASFEGSIDFPSNSNKWSGYTVMQAKFLQISKSPAEDANWLARQLDEELKKFTNPTSKLRKPDYYIIVSNAKLSPQPASTRSKGGISKVEAVFSKHKKRLGLKDFRIWHLDQINTYLLNADSLRRTFAAWLSTSDIIADMIANTSNRNSHIQRSIYRYLTRELRTHQPIRLQQAGYSGDAPTMIEDVFIDLPYRSTDDLELSADRLLLTSLFDRARDCLDQASVKSQANHAKCRPERILILGGPGQGKSTISQFFAQVLRSKIIATEISGFVTAEIAKIAEKTITKSYDMGLGVDIPRRFPFRVDLPIFADKLSSAELGDRSLTLLEFIRYEVSRVADAAFTIEDIRECLNAYPSALILDGLDEVPPSANRDAVIKAVREFWDETVEADLLMVITTRPQGYNDDLGPSLYSKLELVPLNPFQSLEYAEKIADNRIIDINQRERVMTRMRDAVRSSTTSRLLVSPLQVAILLALIDQRGDAPNDRWSLFEKYYQVVLEREQNKTGEVGEIMRHWSRQITALHYKAGFLLHVEAETKGSSDAYISYADLENLIKGQLAEDGFEGEDLKKSSAQLLSASTQRLVLLVQSEEARFRFEVRSLQEFMAAAHLMTGREALIHKRLEVIAGKNHWIHVFQIAASKCFAVNDAEHLRDTIVNVCRSLNEADETIDRLLRTGSRLALFLLDDGIAFDQPKYRRILVSLSLDLMMAGPEQLPSSLAIHCDREPHRVEEKIKFCINSLLSAPRNAAWLLLLYCADKKQFWARQLIDALWPKTSPQCANIVLLAIYFKKDSNITDLFASALEQTSFEDITKSLYRDGYNRLRQTQSLRGYFPLFSLFDRGRNQIKVSINDVVIPFKFDYTKLEDENFVGDSSMTVPQSSGWEPIQKIVNFRSNPSAKSLSILLDNIEDHGWLDIFSAIIMQLPWPLATMIAMVKDGSNLRYLSNKALQGDFGDLNDWRQAEIRWDNDGIDLRDFRYWASGNFFGAHVAHLGAPWAVATMTHEETEPDWIETLFDVAIDADGPPRAQFRRMIAFSMSLYKLNKRVDLRRASFILETENSHDDSEGIHVDAILSFPIQLFDDENVIALIDAWGKKQRFYGGRGGAFNLSTYGHEIVKILSKYCPTHPGLLAFLCNLLYNVGAETALLGITDEHFPENNENRKLSAYSQLLNLCTIKASENLRDLLADDDFANTPKLILRHIIENGPMTRSNKISLVRSICDYLIRHDCRAFSEFSNAIRSTGDQRFAPLRYPECWLQLELGSILFKHLEMRPHQNE